MGDDTYIDQLEYPKLTANDREYYFHDIDNEDCLFAMSDNNEGPWPSVFNIEPQRTRLVAEYNRYLYEKLQTASKSQNPVVYRDGLISQGERSYRLTLEKYNMVIALLWKDREIKDASGVVIQVGKARPAKNLWLEHLSRVMREQQVKTTIDSINRALSANQIKARITGIKNLMLSVQNI